MTRFEWRYFTQQPSFIVTSLIFFLLPFLSVTIEEVQIGGASNIDINSPHAIAQTMLIFGIFAMFLVVNFVANTAIRNDESGMSEIIVTKPISAFSYQFGRFLGAYLVCVSVYAMIPLALICASFMPWLDQERIADFSLSAYAVPFLLFSCTTLFVLSALFYAVALRFRSMMAVYLMALAMFMFYAVSGQVFSSPEQREWLALFDPFALRTYGDVTRYWTSVERNTQVVGLTATVLQNRALWLGVGLVVLLGLSRLFTPLSIAKASASKRLIDASESAPVTLGNIQALSSKSASSSGLLQTLTRIRFEVRQILLSPAFSFLIIYCGFTLIFILTNPEGLYDAPNYPLTYKMVELIEGSFSLALIIIITFYTAEVVWRERTSGMGDIIDSLPTSNFTFWFSKLIAVCLVVLAVLLIGMVVTLLFQLSKAHFHFEISQYLISLTYFVALPYMLLVVLSFFIQVLSPNKYVGMLIFVAYFFVSLTFSQLGLEHNMFNYGAAPRLQYSDMNGYGWAMTTQHHYMIYWGALALMLSTVSYALWQRGPESKLNARFGLLSYQLGSAGRTVFIVATLVFISYGTIIYYNTTVTNEYTTSKETENLQVEYEQAYAQYEDAPVPMMTKMDIDAAIFPEKRRIEVVTQVAFENRTEEPIRRFLVNLPLYSSDIRFDIAGANLVEINERLNTAWLELSEPLQPAKTLAGKISLVRQHFGFKDNNEDPRLVKNGTFINNFELLPSFGVNKGYYLQDKHERRKLGLPPVQRAYALEDSSRYYETFFGAHVGLIDFSASLSTSEDQIAIAPGYLTRYWAEGDRNYFRYEMDAPMVEFFNIMSADLKVTSEVHKGVDITVYYHHSHYWNVDRMIESAKDSLDLFTEVFGPYQHRQLRIIEFPGYRRFAQSFANTVPYSEQIGFISDLRDPNNIDPVYFVTAHEVAHQWFAHQLSAANVQGSQILSESLSQYAALLLMQNKYGEDKLRKFLSHELDDGDC